MCATATPTKTATITFTHTSTPTQTLTPTSTPIAGVVKEVSGSAGEQVTGTPTPVVQNLMMSSLTPSPVFEEGRFWTAAEPNISREREPIRFLVKLNQTELIQLTLYSLSGEQVYQTTAVGSVGINRLLWELVNQSGEQVASGLYVYVLKATGPGISSVKTGKVVVIH
jgi:hypothetical protein